MSPVAENQTDEQHSSARNLGGPVGLGDPDDRSLRKVERDVLIPKLMREKAKAEKCVPEVEAFTSCCRDNSVAMVYFCRTQNAQLRDCLSRWYKDEEFQNICKEQYLRERAEYRRTGINKKQRQHQETSNKS